MHTLEEIKALKDGRLGYNRAVLARVEEQMYCDDSGFFITWDKRYSKYQDNGFGDLWFGHVNQPAREYFIDWTYNKLEQYDYH